MTRTSILVATALALTAGVADARSPKLDWRAARPIGPAVGCIQINEIRETRVRDDSVIDFITRSGKVYRNTIPNGCPGLAAQRAFAYQTSISRLCNVDIITVLYQTPGLQRGASCGLGQFQPVEGMPQ